MASVAIADTPRAQEVLDALIDRDSRQSITLEFDAPAELIADASGRAVDDVLLEAKTKGLIVGDRGEGDESIAFWSRVRLTAAGLRVLGQ